MGFFDKLNPFREGAGGNFGGVVDVLRKPQDLSDWVKGNAKSGFQQGMKATGIQSAIDGPPPAPDFMGLANQQADRSQQNVNAQTLQNRPNQTDAFGNSSTWSVGPDGRPMQTTSLGGMGQGFMDQIRSNGALNFAGLPELGNGQDAMMQAQNAAYNQQTSRLDPMWNQRESQQRTQLLNQGLDPGSEAYTNSMGDLGRARNDAYQGAMNNSIGLGNAAAQQQFGMNLGARQQLGQERMTQHQSPFADLAGMGPSLQGFNAAGMAQTPDLLGARTAAGNFAMGGYNADQGRFHDYVQGLGGIAGGAMNFFKPGK